MTSQFMSSCWQRLALLVALCLMSPVHTLTFHEQDTGKRDWTVSSECVRCWMSYDPQSCTRCQEVQGFPWAKRSGDWDYLVARRNAGCACCVYSRLTNNLCCHQCNDAKRGHQY